MNEMTIFLTELQYSRDAEREELDEKLELTEYWRYHGHDQA